VFKPFYYAKGGEKREKIEFQKKKNLSNNSLAMFITR
jgi:hypothetical protein